MEGCSQIIKRFDQKNKSTQILKQLSIISPDAVMSKKYTSIAPLASNFSFGRSRLNEIDQEWRLLRNLNFDEFASTEPIQEFWLKLSKLNLGDQSSFCSNLCSFIFLFYPCHTQVPNTTETLVVSIAGRLKYFYKNWQEITSDKRVLEWINGYKLPFKRRPVGISNSTYSSDQSDILESIQTLLKQGVVRKVNKVKGQFLSPYFCVSKLNKKPRFILNLKKLNQHLELLHFKMEDYRTAMKLLYPNCFMCTVDLTDAYYTIPIYNKHRRYLRFSYKKCYYEFTCLPFGLATGPYIFTKLMKPVLAEIRRRGIVCCIYLDDFLVVGADALTSREHTQEIISILESLGFIINYKKSNLIPSYICKYLGFKFSSVDMTISLTVEKKVRILKAIRLILLKKICSIRSFSILIGLLVSACPATKYGWLYTKRLERTKTKSLFLNRQDYESKMSINETDIQDLLWWIDTIPDARNNIRDDSFNIKIFTDASRTGWGCFCNGRTANGLWSREELEYHINYLELLAAFYSLKTFAKHLRSEQILLRIDNTTAVSYINRMGSIKYPLLSQLARRIWQWCEERDLWLQAVYISSEENVQADEQSRKLPSDTEYELDWEVFNQITSLFGQPSIDLFASQVNAKCDKYLSWRQDPNSFGIDAFSFNWKEFFSFYAFPPFCLILRTLKKIIVDRALGIVVVPYWETQPWFPLFMSLLLCPPMILPNNSLLFPSRSPSTTNITMMAGVLSGNLFYEKGTQNKPLT